MKYSLTWHEVYSTDIEADSPEEAEKKWRDLEFDDPTYIGMGELIRIDEVADESE